MRRAGRGARRRSGGKCRGGEGRRRCRGGCGCRCMLPRCTVVAMDTSEQGKQQQRGGEHRLPTCRVREGADGHQGPFSRRGGPGGVAARGEGLSRPNRCAAVIHRGVSERVPARDRVGNQGGHAQNARECYAACVQICWRARKCSGNTLRDHGRLCRIRPRSSPDPTRCGLHGGAGGCVRAHRRGDVPPTLPPADGGERTRVGGEPARAGGCMRLRGAQRAPAGARG